MHERRHRLVLGIFELLLVSTLVLGGWLVSASTAQVVQPALLPTLRFSSGSYTWTEGGGPNTITLVLSEPATAQITATIRLTTLDPSLNPVVQTGCVSIHVGQLHGTCELEIVDNACCQPTMTGTLEIIDALNAIVASQSSAIVTVLDDDVCP